MSRYLGEEYKSLESFLICYYFDEEIFSNDEYLESARTFVKENAIDYIEEVIMQAEKILNLNLFNWEKIQDACNRIFSTDEDTKKWLSMITNEIKTAYNEKLRGLSC